MKAAAIFTLAASAAAVMAAPNPATKRAGPSGEVITPAGGATFQATQGYDDGTIQ